MMQTDAATMSRPRTGDETPVLRNVPTAVQLFRYSAITWNSHRIHYDQAYARTEGYPDVLVQSHLHGAFLTRLCVDWIQGHGYLSRLSVSVRRFAVPGDELVCHGTVTSVVDAPDGTRVELDLAEIRSSDSVTCASGTAEVVLLPGRTVPLPVPQSTPTAQESSL